MIVAAALALAAPSAPGAETDIVVLGRRLAEMSTTIGRDDRGRFTCGLTGSSGNVRLDGQLCRAATRCVRQGARDRAGTRACIERRKPALLANFRRSIDSQAAR